MTDGLTDWLIHSLSYSLTHSSIQSLCQSFTYSLIHSSTHSFIHSPTWWYDNNMVLLYQLGIFCDSDTVWGLWMLVDVLYLHFNLKYLRPSYYLIPTLVSLPSHFLLKFHSQLIFILLILTSPLIVTLDCIFSYCIMENIRLVPEWYCTYWVTILSDIYSVVTNHAIYREFITRICEGSLCGDHANCFLCRNILTKYNEPDLHRWSPRTCSCLYDALLLIGYPF